MANRQAIRESKVSLCFFTQKKVARKTVQLQQNRITKWHTGFEDAAKLWKDTLFGRGRAYLYNAGEWLCTRIGFYIYIYLRKGPETEDLFCDKSLLLG